MNKIYTDNRIKAKLRAMQRKTGMVSDRFHASIEESLNSLPKRKNSKAFNFKKAMVAASLILACWVSAIAINPVFAQNIPFIGSTFKQIFRNKVEDETHIKYGVGIGQTQTSGGLTYTLEEAVFDGGELIIGYTIKSHEPFTAIDNHYIFAVHELEVEFNGEKIKRGGSEPYGEFKGQDTFVGAVRCDLGLEASAVEEKLEVSLDIDRIVLNKDTFSGSWSFKFQVDTLKTAPDTKIIKPGIIYEDRIGDLKILEVVSSPLALSITYEVPQDPVVGGFEYTSEYFHFQASGWNVTDDKGNILNWQSENSLHTSDVWKNKKIPGKRLVRFSKPSIDAEYINIKTKAFALRIPLK